MITQPPIHQVNTRDLTRRTSKFDSLYVAISTLFALLYLLVAEVRLSRKSAQLVTMG